MSVKVMSRVFEHSNSKGTNRLMLLCIADNANDDGHAFPGMDLLAVKMGKVSRRSAGNRVRALAKTAELGVYPRKGTSHDYIVFTAMTWAQAKTAIRELSKKRKRSITELHNLRTMFAALPEPTCEEDSLVPANAASQGGANIPSQEPSVEPSVEPSEPKGSGGGRERPIFNAAADVFFGIKDIKLVNGDGGRIAKVEAWLKKAEPDITPERIQAFGTWYDRQTADNRTGNSISRPKDLAKVQEWWARFKEAAEMPVIDDPYLRKRKV